MAQTFDDYYKKLNTEQRRAVDTIEGPLLVIAGPGTGKTQLLAVRIANILRQTDTPPQNILCLTFTDSAALNMRERLTSLIGQAAYDVAIGTYHSFGSDIITSYPEYFTTTNTERSEESRLERPIDELAKHQLLLTIAEKLPYDHPLKSTRYHIGDLIGTLSDLKRALYTPERLQATAQQNLAVIATVSPAIQSALADIKTMPSTYAKAAPLYNSLLDILKHEPSQLSRLAATELTQALEHAELANKSTPLTAWKNNWLHKTAQNTWSFTDPKKSLRLQALAEVLQTYNGTLAANNMYDFDDMILRAIDALKTNDELRFNLQEKYLYILLDEFQDTNAAQFELVRHLTDNPVHEGRPNVMAVGDDDQAIFAFQGAEASNMVDFTRSYQDVQVVALTQNYRSHSDILQTAQNVSLQISERISSNMLGYTKSIVAATNSQKPVIIRRASAHDKAAEYAWVAQQVQLLIQQDCDPNQIAVLAPRHALLESLVPFLNVNGVPVTYEKRENILDTPIISQLEKMAQLVAALADFNDRLAAHLCCVVLSHPGWLVPPETLWQINWDAAKSEAATGDNAWLQAALQHPDTAQWVRFFMSLASRASTDGLESMIDQMVGIDPVTIEQENVKSPLYAYYFGASRRTSSEQLFFETLTQLSVIRQKLRDYQASKETELRLHDLLAFCAMYRAAEQPLLNTHPITQSEQSVQLMTAYKSKGLEFEHVFLLSVHENVWGNRAQGSSNKISLPANLAHIRYVGSNEDELLRLFYVAVTRAKQGLYISSHQYDDSGKQVTPLKFLQETSQVTNDPELPASILPSAYAQSIEIATLTQTEYRTATQLLWHAPHTLLNASLKSSISHRLQHYALSPTHVNTFIDVTYGGPEDFLLYSLLRFPRAPSIDGTFGNVVHEALEWYCKHSRPDTEQVLLQFEKRLRHYLKDDPRYSILLLRGRKIIAAYLSQHGSEFTPDDLCEYNFRREGVTLDDVRLTGKIDRMQIDKANKTITVIDYKTGEGFSTWKRTMKLLKYRQQLCIYKILIERSHSFRGYTVTKGILAFVEPDDDGICHNLELIFDDQEVRATEQLVKAVWQCIQLLDLPDISGYAASYKGSTDFIGDLLKPSE